MERIYSQAQEAQQRGNYREAAERYKAILKLRPNAFEARVNLGVMYHLLGEYPEAIRDFEGVLREKPELFVPNLFLGLDFLQVQQPRRALPYLERAQKFNPQDVQAALQLGRAYADLHEFERANESYLRATTISVNNAEAWYGVGVTYLHLARTASEQLAKEGQGTVYAQRLLAESLDERGWMADAVRAYQKLLASPLAPPCYHAELGFAYLVQGEESEATEQFDHALKNDPGCLLARLGTARINFQRKDTTTAFGQLADVWNADPNFFKANANRLWQGFDTERLENFANTAKEYSETRASAASAFLIEAIEQYRKQGVDTLISAIGPTSDNLRARPAESTRDEKQATAAQLYNQGHYTGCAQKLKPGLDKASRDDLLLLAGCSYNSGDYRLSFDAGSQLLSTDSSSLAALYWQARAGQTMGAIALTRAGLADPNSPRLHLLLAEAYREKDSFREAEAEYTKALQLGPNDVPALLGLAMVYWQDHKYEKAIPQLQSLLALRPGDPEGSYVLASILVARHQFDEAVPYLNAALAGTNSILPQVHALRSKVFAAQGRAAEAVTEIKQSLEADRFGDYHYQLYGLYKTLGDENGAEAALQQSERLRKRRDTAAEYATDSPP